jgi:hypothetical protein
MCAPERLRIDKVDSERPTARAGRDNEARSQYTRDQDGFEAGLPWRAANRLSAGLGQESNARRKGWT